MNFETTLTYVLYLDQSFFLGFVLLVVIKTYTNYINPHNHHTSHPFNLSRTLP